MAHRPAPPEPHAMLCEHCGYILDGLPPGGACPECGQPIADSDPTLRHPSAWQIAPRGSRRRAFRRDSREILLHPTRFFRHLTLHGAGPAARAFARRHWILSSIVFAMAGAIHIAWFYDVPLFIVVFPLPLALLTYGFLAATTDFAGFLTAYEARYRGLRLPTQTVRIGLYYHSAHYLPVAGAALLLTGAHDAATHAGALRNLPDAHVIYLYALAGLVIVSAGYLFWTYWIAMRNLMYANG